MGIKGRVMGYIPTVWINEIGTLLNRFSKTNETVGSVTLTRDPDSISQAGTVFSVGNMNKIEQGLDDLFNNVATIAGAKTFSANATLGGQNNRIVFNSSDAKILIGSALFTDSLTRYRINYNDITSGAVRFDTKSNTINHIWGSWNNGGTLLTHMELTGAGRLVLDGIDNLIDLIQAGADQDKSFAFGRARIGYNGTSGNSASFAHFDFNTVASASLRQNSAGATIIGSALGQTIFLNNNGSGLATLNASAISLLKPVTISSTNTGTAITNGAIRVTAVSDYGSAKNIFYHRQDANQLVINEDSADLTFRVEGIGKSSALVVVGATGNVLINTGIDDLINDFQVEGSGIFSGALTAEGGIKTDNVMTKTKVVEIGEWVTDTDHTISIPHGLTYTDIISTTVEIIDDSGNVYPISGDIPFNGNASVLAGGWRLVSSNYQLGRVTGGTFDGANYTGTQNRGYIYITYKV